MTPLSNSLLSTHARRWLSARLPTRESLVISGFLVLLFEACYLAAFFIRSELLLRATDAKAILETLMIVVALKLFVFYLRGTCHRPWRNTRFQDLGRLLWSATLALLVLVTANHFVNATGIAWTQIPRSVLLIDWALTILAVGGFQAATRVLHDELLPSSRFGNSHNVLVVDASPAGKSLAVHLQRKHANSYKVIGLLDDDPASHGDVVGTAKVLGPVVLGATCASRLRATEIVVRVGSLYGPRLRSLCDAAEAEGVQVRMATLQRPDHGSADTETLVIRDVSLEDLLLRPEARLTDDHPAVAGLLCGRVVMVTGAGGSIGAVLCQQSMRFHPRTLLLVERSEIALFSTYRELTRKQHEGLLPLTTKLVPLLCDITHPDRAERLFVDHRPDVVFHAAAYKHVPLMESHPAEAIENNTLATALLAELSEAHGVRTFVSLSTDKAVCPSSVMGASKLLAERFLQSFSAEAKTRFVVVRFGNVLGSSGSAVPIFSEQLATRQPITITHKDVRRFFMTVAEAAGLVILAGATETDGGTYVLDMGDSIRIVDLVTSMAFAMKIPQAEVRITYCGLRPGEKLEEQLFYDDEQRLHTSHPLVTRVVRPAVPMAEIRDWFAELKSASHADSDIAFAALMSLADSDCNRVTAPISTTASVAMSETSSPQ